MGSNSDSEEFEDDEDDVEALGGDDEVDLDRVFKDIDLAKRRAPRTGEPAWRQLERRMEQQHTRELISDFEDYDIGTESRRRAS